MGVAHGRPAPGVVPNAGLAGGAGIHLDMMLTMGVEGMEAQPCGNAALAWARCWKPVPEPHSPKTLAAAATARAAPAVVGSAALAEHRAPPAAPQAEQQEFGSSWGAGFVLLPARSVLQR